MEVYALGGYSEVGRNMTAIKVDDEVFILDLGLNLPPVVNLEDEERINLSTKKMVEIGAIPDDSQLDEFKDKVKAIIIGHCHLDHIGAIPFLSSKYDCPIIASPFTIEVIKAMLRDDKIQITNKLIPLNINSSLEISKNTKVELINVTHSTLQSTLITLHTKEGVIVYANDFKLDNSPTLGQKTNYSKLRHLNGKVKLLIMESLYANTEGKTPSEKVAHELLKEVLFGTDNKSNVIFVTTFASHIARLKGIMEFGRQMHRKVIFLGRSMAKYIYAAEKVGLIKFSKHSQIIPYEQQIKKFIHKIEKDRSKYFIICSGSQGEPNSILDKLVMKKIPFTFLPGDQVIFSCRTIPQEINIENRKKLEDNLKRLKVRIFTEIHVSGHSSREDLRDMLTTLKPEHLMPSHGEHKKLMALAELAEEEGYKIKENVHIMANGHKINI